MVSRDTVKYCYDIQITNSTDIPRWHERHAIDLSVRSSSVIPYGSKPRYLGVLPNVGAPKATVRYIASVCMSSLTRQLLRHTNALSYLLSLI